jgi:hypothetical protein
MAKTHRRITRPAIIRIGHQIPTEVSVTQHLTCGGADTAPPTAYLLWTVALYFSISIVALPINLPE